MDGVCWCYCQQNETKGVGYPEEEVMLTLHELHLRAARSQALTGVLVLCASLELMILIILRPGRETEKGSENRYFHPLFTSLWY